MSDQAKPNSTASMASMASWMLRDRGDGGLKPSEKIVTFIAPHGADGDLHEASAPQRDWSSALDLIHEASEAIRIAEDRASELEAQIQQITAQAANEMRTLEAQIVFADQRLAKSDERARAAENRASEAEAWLIRLHDAVLGAFAKPLRLSPAPHAIDPMSDRAAATTE